jgi:hypothetical protein
MTWNRGCDFTLPFHWIDETASMARKRKSAHYSGQIEQISITIPNCPPEEMRDKVNKLPFVGYHVETLADGRRVCITKPGGKQFWGNLHINDFMVWIYDESKNDRWRITHDDIYDDVKAKLAADPILGSQFVDEMDLVCKGAEPAERLAQHAPSIFSKLPGLSVELILKTYKWIWVQEDCNYPNGEGRWLSMNGILALRNGLTHKGS